MKTKEFKAFLAEKEINEVLIASNPCNVVYNSEIVGSAFVYDIKNKILADIFLDYEHPIRLDMELGQKMLASPILQHSSGAIFISKIFLVKTDEENKKTELTNF